MMRNCTEELMESADKETPAATSDDESCNEQREVKVTQQSVRVTGLGHHTSQMAPLIGTHTEEECVIGYQKTKVLGESGSLISQCWLEEHNLLQQSQVQDVADLIDQPIILEAANMEKIPIAGYTSLSLVLSLPA